ncbi:SGNH/GDSL hydrolase family protein [Kitasatospora viridis]|uniref:Lysophospholipase L1-like esterase n=1 Tax=Kitasatospora viridis TaxID=281105 RepID=A0A561UKE4_9ACTN|nr:SGNH/GDSL hydrolase family protein [Kitasatospora viridis]TWF99834.1 lysophospholipase L1-like esterase [Kitasatospora viridis]
MLSEQLSGEAADPYCLREHEAERLLAGHPWRRFAVLGDSVAEGLGDPVAGYPDEPWATRIARELTAVRPDLTYLNLGRRNIPAAKVRATQLAAALEFGPDLALVACGGYDILRQSFDAAATADELRAVITPLREHGADVITVSMFAGARSPRLSPEAQRELDRRLAELTAATRALAAELATLHLDLTDHPAAGGDIFSADGRHGNRRCHAISAAEAVRRLGAHLSAAAPATPGAPE